ncbi:KAT8 regulatory NSL complex subunit 2 isoform X2 [Hermetia illucens]|uniref:KAT8 regulatory NSL complex subunit 2 isoform X2 n=1 Tax=Hermetia illucens TaxID=343691 RepID=UPI0018CC58C1|nr:KAT8 regulatory NSL complex subunit 2 isoform X2 [Hermetia illucens]
MAANLNKIITKPQNRGFIVRKPVKTTAEQEKALRDQLHIEIENKSKACSNPTYDCSIPRVEGFEFCIRHILQDPRAPYKQCAYTYPSNGKKCLQPAPKYDGKKEPGLTNYCFEHSRLIQLTKTRNTVGKYKQVETNEAFMNELTHHIKIDGSSTNFTETDEEIDVVSANADPFIHYVHSADFENIGKDEPPKRRLLDYASDSSSDEDMPTTSNTWRSHEWDNSDNESVDSQNEDLLKHAGIYTTEEATMITKQKMMRLQVLYMEQILRLQHLLKEKRRKYLQAIKKERETLCSIHDQPKDTPQERKLYRKLKALNRYHKRYGMEAVLYRKYKEKRDRATEGLSYKPPSYQKCIFSEGGVKCGDRAIPSCKYCKKHILEDKKQVLFRACGVEKSGIVCQEPVPNIFEDATCVLHLDLPPAKAYTQKFRKVQETKNTDNNTITDYENIEK